jgi:hypothetical protein
MLSFVKRPFAVLALAAVGLLASGSPAAAQSVRGAGRLAP